MEVQMQNNNNEKSYAQIYREEHREQKNKYNKDHYNKEYFKQWYLNNKERLLESHICEICNGKYTTTSKLVHLKSKKHINKLSV